MKNLSTISLLLAFFAILACNNDDIIDPLNPIGESKIYNLESTTDPALFGTATFIRNADNSTTIELEIENAPGGANHPAHIHFNSALEGGNIAITLNPVDSISGRSRTTVFETDDGTPITYPELLVFDGYLDIHLSETDLSTVILQGDIGNNELTGDTKIYTLDSLDVASTSGTATFAKRKSGEILVTILVQPTTAGEMHPAHIHQDNAIAGGPVVLTFSPVDGSTGKSLTNITELDDGTPFTFEDLLDLDAHVDVHQSQTDLGTVLAQGDIGQNELTGETEVYLLDAVSDPNISGNVEFAARINRETLVTIMLEGTAMGDSHPAHIHEGSVADAPGNIAVTLNDVVGETGISKTNVVLLDSGDSLSYDELLIYDGYLDVHKSATDLATILAQGNIGANDQ